MLRDPGHIAKCPDFPDPHYYLSFTQKYFFRNAALRHLRVEQFNRYFAMAGEVESTTPMTAEDTINDDRAPPADATHRNYDEQMEETPAGAHFVASCKQVPGCKRRAQSCLGVSRVPFIEPIGTTREDFYESKLVLALPWYCPEKPEVVTNAEGHECTRWTFQWDPPDDLGGVSLESEILKLGRDPVSFEMLCNRLEKQFCDHELGLVCACCTEELAEAPCPACRHATGWHKCHNPANHGHFLWRKGSLHAGVLDVQRVLVPTDVLKEKAQEYVDAHLIQQDLAERVVRVIEQERGNSSYVNDVPADGQAAATSTLTTRLSPAQMAELLVKREGMMQAGQVRDDGGHDLGVTDQWRVYQHIVGCIERGELLRLMVQASAGTGKSFLLTSVYLWCLVHGKRTKAAAPTGIAAANVEIEKTEVDVSLMLF